MRACVKRASSRQRSSSRSSSAPARNVVVPGLARTDVQKIVFARAFPNAGQVGLFIAAADGSDERPLLRRDVDYDPAWAPDGGSIVFTSDREGSADLFRVKPDGTGLERLTDDPAYDDQAAFSPDGRQLVFVSTRNGGTADLWTMDLQTRRAKALTSGTRRRLPAVVVARRPVDRLLVRSRQHAAVRARPLGAPAARRPLCDSSGRHRAEAGHRARQLLRQPEVVGRQPPRDRVLHDGRADAREPPAEPGAGNDTRLVSIDIASGAIERCAGRTRREVQSVGRRRDAVGYIRKDSDDRRGIYYTSGDARPKGDVRAAAWSPDGTRVVFHRRLTAPPTTWMKTLSRNPDVRADAHGDPAVVQPDRRPRSC